ncbi:YcfL family protein [Vibrio aestuarianus]|uniref:YcfL family protein n=1 Tax=Vibrio aestuarianus TaxID=28171 RepID=A0AAX3U579_9VIBR|nr:YcfL family protein [Vibrio aestuarianus]MDE1224562.1 YcfL family protein [Vibrio aestuarianus]MDE1237767.1 YcfL family protein [Vibrio aestuarianus]MDE1252269.1 YcfL family protein [Vibrio aestuarianus]MDE1349087.1 YcfL family protein [Vibrio aestuarianus]WGK82366.1 YcfL family protein [Vibrio aestuarianus]
MKKWILGLLTAIALVGCAANTAGLRVDGASQKVLFGDNVLGQRLVVEDIATKQVDGHTRGIVRLVSQYKGDQNIEYRFYWYDDDGLEVNNKLSPWKQTIISGMDTISLSEVSVNPNGKQFRVQIRESNN